MASLARGLLGGIAGAAGAVSELGKDRIKQLAEHLKLQALADIQEKSQVRGFQHDESMQGERLGAQKEIAKTGRESAEEIARLGRETQVETTRMSTGSAQTIAANKLAVEKSLGEEKLRLDERLRQTQENTEANKKLKIQSDASAKSLKMYQDGSSLDEVNFVRTDAGLQRLEEYVKTPGKKGGLLSGDIPEEKGLRVVGQPDVSRETPSVKTTAADLDAVVQSKKPKSGQSSGKTVTTEQGTPPPPSTQGRGILGGIADAAERPAPADKQELPGVKPLPTKETLGAEGGLSDETGSPESWSVSIIRGWPYINTPQGPVKMTQEQWDDWAKTSKGKAYAKSIQPGAEYKRQ